MTITLKDSGLTLDDVRIFVKGDAEVEIHKAVIKRLTKVREYVEEKLDSHEPFYGINTGVGLLANKRISDVELDKLQENLIVSHAVGVGDPFDDDTVRLIMLLRASVLAMGYSGVRPEVLELLVSFINKGVLPIIPSQGSVSASGDLAPLAHIALALIGRGEVSYRGKCIPARDALEKAGLAPIRLKAKEGLALINGTQASCAVALQTFLAAESLAKHADIAGALSIEGERASQRPFDKRIHKLRPYPGQLATADNVRRLIEGSGIIADHAECTRVQDPYSFRCIPQVHGAVKDVIASVRTTIEYELKSCTDNPLIFESDDDIISGGNFHAETLGFAMDSLAVAIAELGSMSERRVAILNAPLDEELTTKFLVKHSGLNSGFMIPHVTMAALVSENKALAHPATVDTVPTSGGQEDHVSMALIAARKALSIAHNVENILVIELLAACQAIDLAHNGNEPGKGTKAAYDVIRSKVPTMDGDREFRLDIDACRELVQSGAIVETSERTVGSIKLQ
jgi:histidine ammonia-lyase